MGWVSGCFGLSWMQTRPKRRRGFSLLISADTMSADFEKSAEMSADFQQCRHFDTGTDVVSAFSWNRNFGRNFEISADISNTGLGNLLRCLVGKNLRTWDLVLLTVEFAYNSSVNETIGMSPFEVVYAYQPRQHIDLISIALRHTRMSEPPANV